MAFNPLIIPATDFYPNIGVGIDLPLSDPAVFKPNYTSNSAIKNNLINFFLTNKTERYLNPTFGGNLRAFIFQQIAENNVSALKQDIQSQLNLYFPNVAVANLSIDSIPDSNQINVSLTYNVINTGISDNINITFT